MPYSYGKQSINEHDINAVLEVLRSDWLTQGPKVEEFENALCTKLGANHASAVSSGTAALHLTALALGWGKNDIIITSPITFLSSANCILYAGATPDFADIDPVTYTIDVNKLEDRIKSYRSQNKKIKAVIGVDFAGQPCDWQSLRALADEYDFQLVNDACHALGAKYKNQTNYGTRYADAVIYSFHPVKHITTGEGGAVLTDQKKLDQKIKRLRTHGITKDPEFMEKNDGVWYYEMHELGFNYRMTDLQSALGLSQLNRLDEFISKRYRVVTFYDTAFNPCDYMELPQTHSDTFHAWHLYPVQIDFDNRQLDKVKLFVELHKNHINLQVHYIPIHLQPYYRQRFGFQHGDYPVSERFYKQVVSLPIYPDLTVDDLEYIQTSLLSVLT